MRDDFASSSPGQFPYLPPAFKTALVQCPDDVLPELQLPQLLLQIRGQPKAAPNVFGEPQRLKSPQPPPRQCCPGVVDSHLVVDQPPSVGGPEQATIKRCEAVRLGFSPDAALGIGAGEIAEQFLSDFLSTRPKPVSHVVSWDHKVPARRSPAPDQDMRVRMASVVVTGPQPSHFGFAQIVSDPLHYLARVAPEIADPLSIFRRYDEPEVVAILAPSCGGHGRVETIRGAVEKGRWVVVMTGACSAEIGDVRRQGCASRRASPCVTRHQGFHDDPLADVEAEGTA
jgi:hypothetical protein